MSGHSLVSGGRSARTEKGRCCPRLARGVAGVWLGDYVARGLEGGYRGGHLCGGDQDHIGVDGGGDEDWDLSGGQRGEQGGEHAWRVEPVCCVAAVERGPALRALVITGARRADDREALRGTRQGEPLAIGYLDASGYVLDDEVAGEDAESLGDEGSHERSLGSSPAS